MNMKTEYFIASLTETLQPTDVHLPIIPAATTDLLGILQEPDSFMFLSLANDIGVETVKAENVDGTILLTRGVAGTVPLVHPCNGTCVRSVDPTAIAVMKEIACNFNCCEPDECECEKVSYVGEVLPVGKLNVAWAGSVVFSGTLPILIGVDNVPSWASVEQVGNYIKLYGTPTVTGVYNFSVSATNCNGTAIDTVALTLSIEE